MLTLLSAKISSFFITNKIIKTEEKEIYEYSFEILLSTVLNSLFILIVAMLTKNIIVTIFYFFGFLPLRKFAGGYHAKNHFRCFMILVFSYSAFLIVQHYLHQEIILICNVFTLCLSLILIFLLAPVDDKNKPLTVNETIKFKRKSRSAILLYTILVILIYVIFRNKIYSLCVSLGVLTVSLSLLASVVRNKVNLIINHLRGEVYRTDLNPVVGSEDGRIRPTVILQNNVGNRYHIITYKSKKTKN